MHENLLIPTDGNEEMGVVVERALELAEISGARIHVLHVVDERAYGPVPDYMREQVRETLEADGRSATKSVSKRAIERGLDVTRELRWGDPAGAIVAYTQETAVDLVVMGTHGRTGHDRQLVGSVAETVVRSSPVPVLTVPVRSGDDS